MIESAVYIFRQYETLLISPIVIGELLAGFRRGKWEEKNITSQCPGGDLNLHSVAANKHPLFRKTLLNPDPYAPILLVRKPDGNRHHITIRTGNVRSTQNGSKSIYRTR